MIYDKLPGYRWNIIGILGSESKFQILLGQAGAGAGEDGGVGGGRIAPASLRANAAPATPPHRYGAGGRTKWSRLRRILFLLPPRP